MKSTTSLSSYSGVVYPPLLLGSVGTRGPDGGSALRPCSLMFVRNVDLADWFTTRWLFNQIDYAELSARHQPGGEEITPRPKQRDVPFHVGSPPPPSGGMRSHNQPLPRRYGNSEAVLSRLEILGSTHPKTPFLPRTARPSELHQVAEDISRLHKFTRMLHPQPGS